MKIIKFVAISLAAASLAACVKEATQPLDNTGEKTLTLQIAKPQETRAIATPATAGNTVTFSDGKLFLTKSNGEILKVYNFVSSGTTDVNSGGTTIVITDATTAGGVEIKKLPGDIRKAYIVGNTSSFSTALTASFNAVAVIGGNISAVQALKIDPVMQLDSSAAKGVTKATLYGEGALEAKFPGDPDKTHIQKVIIDLFPHIARIELVDITGGSDITQFNVEGVFVNKFYSEMSLDFKVAANKIVDPGQGGATVYEQGVGPWYNNTDYYLHDNDKTTYFGNATVTNLVKTAGTGKVWGYNVLAAPVVATGHPLHGHLGAVTTLASQLIVRVDDVEVSDGSDYSDLHYITVKRFMDNSPTPQEITHFEAGKVYSIKAGEFVFLAKNVKEEANLGEIDLFVEVKPITWTVKPMTPELQ